MIFIRKKKTETGPSASPATVNIINILLFNYCCHSTKTEGKVFVFPQTLKNFTSQRRPCNVMHANCKSSKTLRKPTKKKVSLFFAHLSTLFTSQQNNEKKKEIAKLSLLFSFLIKCDFFF